MDDGCHRIFLPALTPCFSTSSQVDGYTPPALPMLSLMTQKIEQAESFCANLGIEVSHESGDRAFLRARQKVLPCKFRTSNVFMMVSRKCYAVLLHECGHATAAKHRLDRDLSGRFGSEAYAMEECTVELLSAMICADLSISVEPRPDHAAYIATWLKVLRADPRAIFTASSKAQQTRTGCTRGNTRLSPSIEGLPETSRSSQCVSHLARHFGEPLTDQRLNSTSAWVRHGSRMDKGPRSER